MTATHFIRSESIRIYISAMTGGCLSNNQPLLGPSLSRPIHGVPEYQRPDLTDRWWVQPGDT